MWHQRWPNLVLIGWLVGWMFVHASLTWVTTPAVGSRSFNSPDETANYFFARRLALGRSVAVPAPLAEVAGGIVHPRATAVYRGNLVPLSFLGLPVWYGAVGRLFGLGLLPYVTPLLAILGGWALYGWLREIFDPMVAWWSAMLLPLLPPWWYYSARSMFHHVSFLTLVVLGLWLVQRLQRHGQVLAAAGAGLCIGLALTIRTVEALWLIPVLGVVVLAAPNSRRRWWLIATAMLLPWLPIVVQHAVVYGQPFRFGYRLPGPASPVSSILAGRSSWLSWLTPDGIHPRLAWHNAVTYLVTFLPWVFWPAFVGVASCVWRWRQIPPRPRLYLLGTLAVAAVLVPYYGSVRLSDNLDPSAVTLGTSYVRYWLPLYLALLPLVVIGLRWIARCLAGKIVPRASFGLMIFGFAWFSIHVTWAGGPESLPQVAEAIRRGYAKRALVAQIVEPTAVIVAERADKLFFPAYPVVSSLLDAEVQRQLPSLVTRRPVWYYTFLDDASLGVLTQQLDRVGLQLQDPVPLVDDERLWRVVLP